MLYIHATVVSNDTERPFIRDGAVLVKENLVAAVGESAELLARFPEEERRDLQGLLLMPGLINAHTHIYSAYARGMSISKPARNFFEILENLWWSLDRKLNLEDCRLNAATTMIDSIRNGVTTIFDHHSSPHAARGSLFALADMAKEIGMRASFCYEVSDRDGEEICQEEIRENMDFIRACAQDDHGDMIKALFGMHASFTISDRSMEKIRLAMGDTDNGYHIHVAEGAEDEADCLKKYGKRVAQRLRDWGILGPQTLAVHGIHCNEEELEIIRENGSMMVHNPMSNMGNAVGAAPVVDILRRGILCGLGTDAYTSDMIESMKVAKILQSHALADPTVGFGQALQLQFANNPLIAARYFRRPLGVLKEGAYADLITLDYRPSTPLHDGNWGGHVLFGFFGGMVRDVVINGREVMRSREILTIDEEALTARSAERAAEIWREM